jgi:hypothetical protein
MFFCNNIVYWIDFKKFGLINLIRVSIQRKKQKNKTLRDSVRMEWKIWRLFNMMVGSRLQNWIGQCDSRATGLDCSM